MSELRLSGEPGQRVAVSEDGAELTEHAGCGWIVLRPVRTWAEWREFAEMILAAGTVDEPETAGT